MPCWEVNTVSVDLKAADWAILKNALKDKANGFSDVSINDRTKSASAYHPEYGDLSIEDGQVTVETYSQRAGVAAANAINRAYSRQVLKGTAAKYGWALRNKPGTNQYTAVKKY